jgi:hypothetical protein
MSTTETTSATRPHAWLAEPPERHDPDIRITAPGQKGCWSAGIRGVLAAR